MWRVDRFLLLALLLALTIPLVISEAAAQVPMIPGQGAAQPKFPPPEELAQLVYSPWTKLCTKVQDTKHVCFTGSTGWLRNGMSAVTAVLIEPQDRPDKALRVTLPLGVSITSGMRVIVDRDEPTVRHYDICSANGCMAHYDATAVFIRKLKRARNLVVQGYDNAAQQITLMLSLVDFAKAYDGPPSDPKTFEMRRERPPERWQDDTLQPHLRPGYN
jgi:invasion protein IalB